MVELFNNVDEKLQIAKYKILMVIFTIFILLLVIFIVIVGIKLEQKGEWKKYFEIDSFQIISSVDVNRETGQEKDTLIINELNDIYLKIKNNDRNKINSIKSVKIKNIKIVEATNKENIRIYQAGQNENNLFGDDKREIMLEKDEMIFVGDGNEIMSVFRIKKNNLISEFIDKNQTIEYNLKILNGKIKNNNDLKIKLTYDLIIELNDGKKYMSKMNVSVLENIKYNNAYYIENKDTNNLFFTNYKK